jgi:hypothetical protein
MEEQENRQSTTIRKIKEKQETETETTRWKAWNEFSWLFTVFLLLDRRKAMLPFQSIMCGT